MKINRIIVCILLLTSLACTREELYFESPANQELEQPLLLNFDEQPCFLDSESNVLKFSIREDERYHFSPMIDFQDHSTILFDGVLLENHAINDFGQVEINTAYPIEIRANNQTEKFTLYFTTLPLVQIVTLDKIIQEPKVFGRLNVVNPEQNNSFFSSLMGIETRGSSSRRADKKSYGFKMINSLDMDDTISVSFFDLKRQNKWILDGMSIDKTRCRNKTNFEIWGNLSGETPHVAIKSKYVELYHNYTYLGIYCFSENVTEQFLSLSSESVLIVGKDNTDATKFEEFSNKNQASYWDSWLQKYPDPDECLRWETFEDLCQLITEGGDSEFANTIFNLMDEENLVDYLLFVNLINGYDNLGKNWFFMQKSPNDKFLIIPWDLDATWGRNHESKKNYERFKQNGLFERLIEVNPNDFKQKTKDRWFELRQNNFAESTLINHFSSNFTVLENSQTISLENHIWDENINLSEEETNIQEWLTKRLSFLDDYFEKL